MGTYNSSLVGEFPLLHVELVITDQKSLKLSVKTSSKS